VPRYNGGLGLPYCLIMSIESTESSGETDSGMSDDARSMYVVESFNSAVTSIVAAMSKWNYTHA